jgi:hypothetical protein
MLCSIVWPRLHGTIPQKTVIFILATMRTWNLTYFRPCLRPFNASLMHPCSSKIDSLIDCSVRSTQQQWLLTLLISIITSINILSVSFQCFTNASMFLQNWFTDWLLGEVDSSAVVIHPSYIVITFINILPKSPSKNIFIISTWYKFVKYF